eukprot:3644541-Pleurochrysis_carterae.AAC.2
MSIPNKLRAERVVYRAGQCVGASGRERRRLRKRARVRPAVVDGGDAAHRLPPGGVSLSAPREEKPVRNKSSSGCDRNGDSAGAGERNGHCTDGEGHVRGDGAKRTRIEHGALHADDEGSGDKCHVHHQGSEGPAGDRPRRGCWAATDGGRSTGGRRVVRWLLRFEVWR